MKGLIIAGAGSGVGKTSVTTGILSRLSKNYKVQAFKAGPDFIDTMYHAAATGRPSRNLDSFMMDDDVIRNLVGYASKDADLCIVEGVRGLYEGFSGDDDLGSTAYLAKLLGFPVILVLDARSLTRSAAAIVNGFKMFDPDVNIAGVILNKVSGGQHRDKLDIAMRTYTDVKVVGMIPKDDSNVLEQRYLGLRTLSSFTHKEITPLESLTSSLDLDTLMDIAEHSESDLCTDSPYVQRKSDVKAAVPIDDSYCFYYKENIECLEASGMKVRTFRPTEGDPLPDADVYYLGGGYPELYADKLSQNTDYLQGLKSVSEEGKVVFGECGGLMTMCKDLIDKERRRFPMAGIFDADADMTNIRHGPTYVVADAIDGNPLFNGRVKGHEYHYSDVFTGKDPKFGYDVIRGMGIVNKKDGLFVRNSLGSYMHQHALSTDDWAKGIVEAVK
ncbi:MAG: hydrogenobyrinic acid a,c-diamide synthase (glutamine-hydrolyzing) [Candidatus Methanogranum gryphiswaldense]|nr:MAG: hydrogenobyrinic acid a,c-diamide synthase (glutamine-hydrolyzing) [Candidatus Methanogranum sp. U3.2.1]